jgi:galactokinase
MSDLRVTTLSDTAHFLASLESLRAIAREGWDDFLSGPESIITRAPGRLDVMGGIADYSGSLVLQLPIAAAAHVALQKTDEKKTVRIVSLPASETGSPRCVELPLGQFLSNRTPSSYSSVRSRFTVAADDHWAAYVAGSFLVLMHEKKIEFSHGADILIRSHVPEGKGVSSSAALEVAVMQAVATAFEISLSPTELGLLCQMVENRVAGAPCGIMDQMTSACGEADRLLELLCQPCALKGTLAVPDELELWGIDSGVRHSVGGSDYGTVRTAAFMGYRIIAERAGLKTSDSDRPGKVNIADSKWNGYLANLTPPEFDHEYKAALPVSMQGREFLEQYGGITDEVTSVKRDVAYPVLHATQHPVYEHNRVKLFATTLKNWNGLAQASALGELMFQSHQSYSDCGLGSAATDLIVDLVRQLPNQDLYGARITGGGSGGTVAVLGRRGATNAIKELSRRFEESTGHRPLIMSGSSSGAVAFGHIRVANEL